MATTGTSAADTIHEIRRLVQTCAWGGGSACREHSGRSTCVAGIHLWPAALNLVTYPAWTTKSGRVFHQSQTCPALSGRQAQQTSVGWARLNSQACSTCRTTPAAVVEAIAEARTISSALGVISAASSHWPGRLPHDVLAGVEAAATKIAKAKGPHLKDLRTLALTVVDLLRATASDGWRPAPCPPEIVRAAAVDLVGVDDDPFFRSGSRPRTAADRAVAEASAGLDVDGWWSSWRDAAARGQTPSAASRTKRPEHTRAVAALHEAWQDATRRLIEAESDARVVALPVATDPGARSAGVSAAARLVPLAAVSLSGRPEMCLVVVPRVVARWLARAPLATFEDIGPWPGDDLGVEALDILVRISDGRIDQMPKLLDAAVALAQE